MSIFSVTPQLLPLTPFYIAASSLHLSTTLLTYLTTIHQLQSPQLHQIRLEVYQSTTSTLLLLLRHRLRLRVELGKRRRKRKRRLRVQDLVYQVLRSTSEPISLHFSSSSNRTDECGVHRTERFLLTAADQKDGSRSDRLARVIHAKFEAGLLRPYNHVAGYTRLMKWMADK